MAKDKIVCIHNIGNYLHRKRIPFIPMFIHRFIRTFFAFDLPIGTEIGDGTLFIHNGLGCVIHPRAIIGKNCKIYQNVSIAGRNGRGAPIIGDNVFIGAGACILGGVKIGNNVVIGAMTLILTDIPNDCTVVGNPARIIKRN